MTTYHLSRRKALKTTALFAVSASTGIALANATETSSNSAQAMAHELPFRISLNTSTLMAYKLPVDVQIAKVAQAGFNGIELWMRDIVAYLDNGGTTTVLREQLEKANLTLENIIGFSDWCSDDATKRATAITQLKEEMHIIKAIGGNHIAAPVMGLKTLDPNKIEVYAARYSAILALEAETGVLPVIELWGMGALHKISDCAQIVIATGHPKATMLLDFYHVHRGGNSWETIDVLNGAKLPVMHMNDYPSTPSFDKLTDADRVLPGKGVCDFNTIIPKLYHAGFRGGFSVELFNKSYWETMTADELLQQSYDTTLAVLTNAMAKTDTYQH